MLGNTTMLTPRRWLEWPSGTHFLPNLREQKLRPIASLQEVDGTRIDADLHDVATWERLKLGPFDPRSGVTLSAEDRAFFVETLKRAAAYRELMVHDPSVKYPPMAVVASDAAATPVAFRRPAPDALFDFEAAITVAGDGRFDIASVGPPTGVPVCARFTSKASHQDVAVDYGFSPLGQNTGDVIEKRARVRAAQQRALLSHEAKELARQQRELAQQMAETELVLGSSSNGFDPRGYGRPGPYAANGAGGSRHHTPWAEERSTSPPQMYDARRPQPVSRNGPRASPQHHHATPRGFIPASHDRKLAPLALSPRGGARARTPATHNGYGYELDAGYPQHVMAASRAAPPFRPSTQEHLRRQARTDDDALARRGELGLARRECESAARGAAYTRRVARAARLPTPSPRRLRASLSRASTRS